MDYFSRFLRSGSIPIPKVTIDHGAEFNNAWIYVKNTLQHPDERQLARGIKATNVPGRLQSMVDSLVWESSRTDEGDTGACLEYLLKNDVLGTLVRLSETDRPFGIQAEVLRTVSNMVVLLPEQFLVHSAVHKSVLRLLRSCVGDELQEQLDGRKTRGAAGSSERSPTSDYEFDLVNLLCILCSRIRTHRELLMIFFHDKHWYHSEPLFAVEEEEEEEEEEAEESEASGPPRQPSPAHSETTIKSGPNSSISKPPEYEFLLFNYLVRFVHREGQIGDFARAGLLFLMDVAMSSGGDQNAQLNVFASPAANSTAQDPVNDAALALAEYILDGDFSEVLAAGLGAVYSLFPSRLQICQPSSPSEGSGMILGAAAPETVQDKEKQSIAKERALAMGLEESDNAEFVSRLDHFLKLMEFMQDILRRNTAELDSEVLDASFLVGSAIVQSILDAVRRIFLENVLYSSILECSDTDGSAVAVMSYIEIIIRTLAEGGPLVDLLVEFLVSEDNDDVGSMSRLRQHHHNQVAKNNAPPPSVAVGRHRKDAKLRRRKSSAMILLEMEAPDSRRPSDYFTSMARFTLKDLVMTNLKSPVQAASTAALRLLDALLVHQCQLCIYRFLIVSREGEPTSFPEPARVSIPIQQPLLPPLDDDEDDDDEKFTYRGAAELLSELSGPLFYESLYQQPVTTYSTHEREMGLYLALVSRVDPSHNEDAFSTGYEHYLRDAFVAIQRHRCFRVEMQDDERASSKHRLNPNDPMLTLILESMRTFFSNTPAFNVALTGVLSSLAVCPDRSLAGWLTFASNDAQPEQSEVLDIGGRLEEDGDDRSIDFKIEEKLSSESNSLPASSLDPRSRPVLHSIFHGLVSQLERYRELVQRFDQFLLERRQGLLFSENLTDALSLGIGVQIDVPATKRTQPPTTAASNILDSSLNTTQRPTPIQMASSFMSSVLTPKRNRAQSKGAVGSAPSTPSRSGKAVAVSPFGHHYEQTSNIEVEPFAAPFPTSGPWTPAKRAKWNGEEEDVFSSSGQWGGREKEPVSDEEEEEDEDANKREHVTLSRLLDNVVILEESIKELAAIVHARRSLGIDSVRYL